MTSPGLATDLMMARWSGEVVDRGDHLVVRHPDEPLSWTGNAIVVAPGADLDGWEARFAAAFPAARHRAIRVDGDVDAALAAAARARGYRVGRDVVLAANDGAWRAATPAIRPPADEPTVIIADAEPPPPPTLRPLGGDDDWDAQLMLAIASDELEEPRDDVYRMFLADRVATRRAWTEAGRGAWWGAFDDGRLIGSLGLFAEGGLARYQDVVTHPDHRRRGVATALIVAAARASSATTFVLVAAADSDAARLYQRLGFAPVATVTDLIRPPPS